MVSRKKQIIVLLAFFLALIPLVSTATFQVNENNGYQIFYPEVTYIQQDSSFLLHIHVLNQSTGKRVLTSQANCELHIYNSSGMYTFKGLLDEEEYDEWELDIQNNFTDLGEHSFFINCNNSAFGGAVKGTFEVNRNGIESTTPRAIMNSSMMFILIALFVFIIWLTISLQRFSKDDDDKILSVNKLHYLKFPLISLAYGILMGIFWIAANIGYGYLGDELFADLFFTLFTIMMKLYIPLLMVVSIWLLVQVSDDRKIAGMIERGVDFGGGNF